MVRKILCCVVILALMSFCVVPAFAASTSPVSYSYCQFPVTQLSIDDGSHTSVLDWPRTAANDYSVVLTEFIDTSSTVPFCTIHTYLQDDPVRKFNNEIYLPGDVSKFTLQVEYYYFNSGPAYITLPADLETSFRSLSISGVQSYVDHADQDNYYYEMTSPTFFKEWYFASDEVLEIELTEYIWDATLLAGGKSSSVCFLYITFELWPISTGDIPVFFSCKSSSTSPYAQNFSGWFNKLKLTHSDYTTVVEGGLFDWLLNSVNALFNIQIAPGITLNTMFVVVLVIVVLLAVIKIMH